VNRQALLAWLIISAAVGSFFGPAVIRGRPLAFRDSAHFYYPLFQWCQSEWSAGRVPVWNPAENCGTPILADATSSVFYPVKLVFALPLKYASCFNLYIVLHIGLAAAGTYALARAWHASASGAALAAIAYTCGGSVVFQYCNVVFLVGAAWFPLGMLLAERTIRCGRWKDAIGLGAVLAFMVLGGDPQAAYHSILVAALYGCVIQRRFWRAKAWTRPHTSPAWFGKRVALLALAGSMGVGLSAIQILPSLEAARWSERAAFNRPRNIYEAARVGRQDPDSLQPLGDTRATSIASGLLGEPEPVTHHEAIYEFSVGPWRFAELVWPNVSGKMFPIHRRWMSFVPGEGRIWTPTLYVGLLVAVLGIGGLVRRERSARLRWLKCVLVLGSVGSLGFYGLGWLTHELSGALRTAPKWAESMGSPVGGLYWSLVTFLPGYAYFRFPAKLMPIAALAGSMLAGVGLQRSFMRREAWLAGCLGLLSVGSLSCALGCWLAGSRILSGLTARDPALGPFDAAGARMEIILAFTHTAVIAAVIGILAYWSQHNAKIRAGSQWLALVVTVLDLWVANSWTIVSIPPAVMYRESSVATQLEQDWSENDQRGSIPRVWRGNVVTWQPKRFRNASETDRLEQLTRWERETLLPRFPLADRVSLVESHGSIISADLQALWLVAKQHGPRQADKSLTPQPSALRLLSTDYLILPESHQVEFATKINRPDGDWPEDAALWRMNRSLPRAWIVHQVDVLPELHRPFRKEALEDRALAVLFPQEKARDFQHSAVIETDQPNAEWAVNSASAAGKTVSHETCRLVTKETQRVVVEVELHQPGLLVLADAWYPGWKAIVHSSAGTQEVPIYRTNRVLRGVWLQAGRQTVEFEYRPASFYAGAAISAGSWLLVGSGALIFWLRRNRGSQRQIE